MNRHETHYGLKGLPSIPVAMGVAGAGPRAVLVLLRNGEDGARLQMMAGTVVVMVLVVAQVAWACCPLSCPTHKRSARVEVGVCSSELVTTAKNKAQVPASPPSP